MSANIVLSILQKTRRIHMQRFSFLLVVGAGELVLSYEAELVANGNVEFNLKKLTCACKS